MERYPAACAAMTGNHEMYKVFTPLECLGQTAAGGISPSSVVAPKVRSGIDKAGAIHYAELSSSVFRTAHFPVEVVIAQLRQFCQNGAGEYEQQRDFPAVEHQSFVRQPWYLLGSSPRQCLHRLSAEQPQALDGGAGSVWLNELISAASFTVT
ncbi:hypothetical protein ACNKHP_21325 [Shigella boydii]